MSPVLSNPSEIMAVIGIMEGGFVGPGVLWSPWVPKGWWEGFLEEMALS